MEECTASNEKLHLHFEASVQLFAIWTKQVAKFDFIMSLLMFKASPVMIEISYWVAQGNEWTIHPLYYAHISLSDFGCLEKRYMK